MSYPRYIEGVDVAIMFKAVEPAVTRVSMRSKSVDVSAVAVAFGGGGHLRAAGCTIYAPVEEARTQLLEALANWFNMDAIFNVLKPPQMTSHDVIGFLRRVLNTKKIGHGGTLDPDAAGVLPVFAGSATRLLEFAVEGRKEYIANLRWERRQLPAMQTVRLSNDACACIRQTGAGSGAGAIYRQANAAAADVIRQSNQRQKAVSAGTSGRRGGTHRTSD